MNSLSISSCRAKLQQNIVYVQKTNVWTAMQSQQPIEFAVCQIQGVSLYFQGEKVTHNLPSRLSRIEDVEQYCKNTWVKVSRSSDYASYNLHFHLKLYGGGILDKIPEERLQKIKEQLKQPETKAEAIVSELLEEDLIEICDMEGVEKELEELQKNLISPIQNSEPEEESKEQALPADQEKYIEMLFDQRDYKRLPDKHRKVAETRLQKKYDQPIEEGSQEEGSQLVSYSQLSDVLARVPNNSLFLKSSNEQLGMANTLIKQFYSGAQDLYKKTKNNLKKHTGLADQYIESLENFSRTKQNVLKEEIDPVKQAEKLLAITKIQAETLEEHNEIQIKAAKTQEEDMSKQTDIFQSMNTAVMTQYVSNTKAMVSRMNTFIEEHRGKELDAFIKEQAGRQKVKEEEYELEFRNRLKQGELTAMEQKAFLSTREKEEDIKLQMKEKGFKIDLEYNEGLIKQEKAKLERELEHNNAMNGSVEQRHLMEAYKIQVEIYEKDVSACRSEIQDKGGRKNYRLSLRPPEIKYPSGRPPYIEPGHASYHITS